MNNDIVLVGGPADGEQFTAPPGTNDLRWAAPPTTAYLAGVTERLPMAQAAEVVVYSRCWPERSLFGRAVFTTTGHPPEHLEQLIPPHMVAAAPARPSVDETLARIDELDLWEFGPDAASWRARDVDEPPAVRPASMVRTSCTPTSVTYMIEIDTSPFVDAMVQLAEQLEYHLNPWQRRLLAAVAVRAFGVPPSVVTGCRLDDRRHTVRSAYRRRQLARRRR